MEHIIVAKKAVMGLFSARINSGGTMFNYHRYHSGPVVSSPMVYCFSVFIFIFPTLYQFFLDTRQSIQRRYSDG